MKNFLLFLLLFSSIEAYTQIKTEGSIEMGYEDRTLQFSDNTSNVVYASTWLNKKEFADIRLNADYRRLSLYTNVKTYFNSDKFYSYDPLQVEYKIGMSYSLGKNKRFLFIAEHLCSHSIESKFLYETYDKFSVKIKLFDNH